MSFFQPPPPSRPKTVVKGQSACVFRGYEDLVPEACAGSIDVSKIVVRVEPMPSVDAAAKKLAEDERRTSSLKETLDKSLADFVVFPLCETVLNKQNSCTVLGNRSIPPGPAVVSVIQDVGDVTLNAYCVRAFRNSADSVWSTRLGVLALVGGAELLDRLCKSRHFHNDAHLGNFMVSETDGKLHVRLIDNGGMTYEHPDITGSVVSPNDTPTNVKKSCHFDAFGFATALAALANDLQRRGTKSGPAGAALGFILSKLERLPDGTNAYDMFQHMASKEKELITSTTLLDALKGAFQQAGQGFVDTSGEPTDFVEAKKQNVYLPRDMTEQIARKLF